MAHVESPISLAGVICGAFLYKHAKKGKLGKHYLGPVKYMRVNTSLYYMGAMLGCARRHKLKILAKMFAKTPDYEDKAIGLLRDKAEKRLAKHREDFSQEPESFFHLILLPWMRKGIDVMAADNKSAAKLEKKVTINKETERNLQFCFWEGIVFGSSFPELTARMHQYAKSGVQIESPFLNNIPSHAYYLMPLNELEKDVLVFTAEYISQYYPELVTPLELDEYLT